MLFANPPTSRCLLCGRAKSFNFNPRPARDAIQSDEPPGDGTAVVPSPGIQIIKLFRVLIRAAAETDKKVFRPAACASATTVRAILLRRRDSRSARIHVPKPCVSFEVFFYFHYRVTQSNRYKTYIFFRVFFSSPRHFVRPCPTTVENVSIDCRL